MSEIRAKSKNETSLKNHVKGLFTQFKNLVKVIESYKPNYFDDYKKIIEYSIFCHDLGKVSPSFQVLLKNTEYNPKVPFPDLPHSIFSLIWINDKKIRSIIPKEDIKLFYSSIAFHHWRDNFQNIILGQDSDMTRSANIILENNILRLALLDNLKNEFKEDEFFKDFIDVLGFNDEIAEIIADQENLFDFVVPPYYSYFMPQRIINFDNYKKKKFIITLGTLIRVDHFASYTQDEGLDQNEENREKFKIEKEIPEYETIKNKIVSEILEKSPNNKIWQLEKLGNTKNESLILVAPTGIGKTEFAYLWGAGEKLFITLPLRSAVNSIYNRSEKIFEKKNSKNHSENVCLLHSDADIYLTEKSSNYEGENIRVQEMASHLSYPVIVSTGDQIFPSALKSPSYEKIYSVLSYSKLVIDEVQAYDPQSIAVIIKLIEDITHLGGKFLLMTATLPNFVKDEIKKRTGIEQFIDMYYGLENLKKHKLELFEEKINSTRIIDEIITKAKNGSRVLVILNSVKESQDIYNELEKRKSGVDVFLLHSKFTMIDRKMKELNAIDINFKNPKKDDDLVGKILVSTQIVEASVDIDCDFLYTEIAPLDSLVQRMGRILRRIKTTQSFEYELNDSNIKVFYRFDEKNFESSKGYVYEKEILEKSIKLLYEKIFSKDWEKIKNESKSKIEENNKNKKTAKSNSQEIKDYDVFKILASYQKSNVISEVEKKSIVEKLYSEIEKTEYFKRFERAMLILDSGYMSESKSEAQKFFRDISTVPSIPSEIENKFLSALDEFLLNNEEFNYTNFKSDILSKFIININMNQIQVGTNFETLSKKFLEYNFKSTNKKNILKINKWIKSIYIYNGDYNNKTGANILRSNNKQASYDFL